MKLTSGQVARVQVVIDRYDDLHKKVPVQTRTEELVDDILKIVLIGYEARQGLTTSR